MAEEKLQKQADQFGLAVDNVHRALGPILNQPLDQIVAKLTAIQRCELEALVAYSINTLFWIYLKANGVPPKEHPVINELQRVQRYIAKINKTKAAAAAETDGSARTAGTGDGSRPMQVDKDAAGRLIRNAVNSK
ncbi:hypothetical protein H4217_005291 [Coemansia sp. RSA 1939]|nr:hypothetical protein H4217_005291 [Coemansia sp. RSA 1939]KAJ2595139.1 hypothetical protein EV177_008203 [Coemansia sp. RSA 1804]